jgi:hypothetical protein
MSVTELLDELDKLIEGHPLSCECKNCTTRDTITEVMYQVHLRTGVSYHI